MRQGRVGSGARQGQRQVQVQGQENGRRAEQKGRGRAGQGNSRQGQDKGSGMAGRLRRFIIIFFLLSIAPEKGTLGAHKKWSGITYVTYMVVTPLILRSPEVTKVQLLRN